MPSRKILLFLALSLLPKAEAKVPEAAKTDRASVESEPVTWRQASGKGLMLHGQNRFEQSVGYYEKAIALAAKDPKASYDAVTDLMIDVASVRLNEGRIDEAKRVLDRIATERMPQTTSPLVKIRFMRRRAETGRLSKDFASAAHWQEKVTRSIGQQFSGHCSQYVKEISQLAIYLNLAEHWDKLAPVMKELLGLSHSRSPEIARDCRDTVTNVRQALLGELDKHWEKADYQGALAAWQCLRAGGEDPNILLVRLCRIITSMVEHGEIKGAHQLGPTLLERRRELKDKITLEGLHNYTGACVRLSYGPLETQAPLPDTQLFLDQAIATMNELKQRGVDIEVGKIQSSCMQAVALGLSGKLKEAEALLDGLNPSQKFLNSLNSMAPFWIPRALVIAPAYARQNDRAGVERQLHYMEHIVRVGKNIPPAERAKSLKGIESQRKCLLPGP